MKRFVLVQRDEKDPMWKSSDNLLPGSTRPIFEDGIDVIENQSTSSENNFNKLSSTSLTVPSLPTGLT